MYVHVCVDINMDINGYKYIEINIEIKLENQEGTI